MKILIDKDSESLDIQISGENYKIKIIPKNTDTKEPNLYLEILGKNLKINTKEIIEYYNKNVLDDKNVISDNKNIVNDDNTLLYLDNKNVLSDNISVVSDNISVISSSCSNISNLTSNSSISENSIVSEILSEKDEESVIDEFTEISDKNLIKRVKNLLEEAHKYNITEYYSENNIKYRAFNLSSLYSEKYGFRSKIQKDKIKDMARKCIQFLDSEYVNIKKREIKINEEKEKKIKKEKFNKMRKQLDEQERLLNIRIINSSDESD
jgi:hypothetical protein